MPRSPPFGRHSFQIGLGLFDDFDGNGAYSLSVRHQMLPANRLDGEWQTVLQIGSSSKLFSEFYQPLGPSLRWFVAPSITFSRIRQDIWFEGQPFATYQFDEQGFEFGGGRVLGNRSEIRLTAFYFHDTLDQKIGDPIFPNLKEDRAGSSDFRKTLKVAAYFAPQ